MGRGFTCCGKSQFKAAFSGTGTLACAGFAAVIIDAQPRVAVLLNFFRSHFSRDMKPEQKLSFRVYVATRECFWVVALATI
jgi:hypothetical protein